MTTYRKFTAFFNILPGEERLIGLLVLLNFSLGLGVVFVQSMAFGVFIAEYGVQGLPYSYISIALLASLVAILYIKLSGRVSFSRLLNINLVFLGSTSLLIWLALTSSLYHTTAFILPLWFQTAINLVNLAVWPLAGSLFNFQQGKRLFPLLGAGNWLANIIGGLFIPALVKSIGAVHLLLLASVSFGLSLLVLSVISRLYLQQKSNLPATGSSQHTTRPVKAPTGILKDRYILLIFAYITLWWVAFYFADNIFFDRAFVQYPNADQLASFIGQLLSITGIVALVSSTVLTSRIIARFGLRIGLLTMPLMVTLSLSILAISGSLGAPLFFIFALGVFAKLVNVALGFSLSQSANAIVYQSLPDTIRSRVQAAAEGIVQPIAIGLAGLILLTLTSNLKFSYIGLAYVFIGLSIAWLIVIFSLSGNYIEALTRVITKRRLGDDATVLADPASLSLLRRCLQDSHPGVVIYALTKLEVLDEQVIISELPNLIQHPAPEIRREAFIRIEKKQLRSVLNAVQKQYSIETIPSVKESALRALGTISDNTSQLTNALNETDIYILRGALIGLLTHGNESAAVQKIEDLLASFSNADRNLAIGVLGEVKRREFYPRLVAACDSPATSRTAGLALVSIGTAALTEIELAYGSPEAPRQRLFTLSKVLGFIGGTYAQNILLSRISESDHEVRLQILNALSQSGYRARDFSAIQRAVKAEVGCAAWVTAAQADLGNKDETALLMAALDHFYAQIRTHVLLQLSFAFDHDSIRRVHEVLTAGSAKQISYALEIIDAQLPPDWKPWVMPLLENLSAEERSQCYAELFPQEKQKTTDRLCAIIENKNFPFWVRACAVHTFSELNPNVTKGDPFMLSIVEKVLILKTVSIFSQTPDNVLADVADILEEVNVSENESIFKQGEPGDSLYVIVDGKVRVHDGERLLNYLGERDVFGEMALLDPEPRLASVTAVEETRLFRLEQAPFYELMSERPEVATGIIRVLTGHLRNRVRDIAQLNARVKELESGSSA